MTPLTDRCDEAMARALVDADPTMTGHHESHIAIKRLSARAARLALLAALDAEGWQVVPKVATEGMLAVVQPPTTYASAYTAMLAAAPHPFPEDKP